MTSEIQRRGKGRVYYANTSFMGVRIRDCLKTVVRDEAIRRLIELKLSVERGEYQRANLKFNDLVAGYTPSTSDKESIVRIHLLEEFGGMKVGDIDAVDWAIKHAKKHTESSCKKHFQVMRELGFELPKVKFKKGKQFGRDHILEESQVLNVVNNFVNDRYKNVCLISMYSGLRLKSVVQIKKREVDLKGGWLNIEAQSKTRRPVSIPLSEKLRAVFERIKVWPLKDDGRIFPEINERPIVTQVRRAFHRAGIPWGSFHHFRHFAACHMINKGVPLEVVKEILGHSDFRSTLIYARIKQDKLKEAVKSFDTNLTQIVGQ
ncbi:MAG: tyrosine-type recombinase/integrase [Nitrospinales bacterium]